jgi:hypothetical protein
VPFLRVIRDKRGYETTYLMHWFRDGQRQRSRILYVFRSPAGVRVGRQVLEPEIQREIEANHPDVEFDWPSVREQKQVIDAAPEPWRRKRSEEAVAKPKAAPAEAVPQQPPRPAVPSTIEGSTPAEQMAFLALWYPQLRDRIAQRTSEPGRRDALLALAERLNPAAWIDADEIAAGLQAAAESLERLSHVFARRRRRTRKRPAAPAGEPPDAAASVSDPDSGTDAPAAVE